MLFDTDILIWIQRGNEEAARILENDDKPCISTYTYMELLQCMQNKKQHKLTRDFLKYVDIAILPLSHTIGQRATVYVEEYGLSHSMRAGDAIIAATAIEHNISLCSGNKKHFTCIKELDFVEFITPPPNNMKF